MNDWDQLNDKVVEQFRADEGRVGGPFEGVPLILVHHTGARSGKRRVNPMGYLPAGDRIVVFASKGGADTNPDWYYNLLAHPEVTVETGTETFRATATVVTGGERDALCARAAEEFPFFADYQSKTRRVIPVVALQRL